MKLLASPTSPYARKLRVLALELGLDLTIVDTAPLADDPVLLAANPLGKVPALLLDGGRVIFDSPVIAGFLLSVAPDRAVLAPSGPAHWDGRTTEALADGVLDAAITVRFNAAQGITAGAWIDRQYRAIDRALAALAGRIGSGAGYPELCTVIACEYLDLRFPAIDWRTDQPALAALHTALADRASLRDTRPPA